MKNLLFLLSIIAFTIPTLHAQESQNIIDAIKELDTFVKKAYVSREEWFKTPPDTEIVEQPVDPNDPTIVRIDTFVLSSEAKRQNPSQWAAYNLIIEPQYQNLLRDLRKREREMPPELKAEYDRIRKEFDGLMEPAKK